MSSRNGSGAISMALVFIAAGTPGVLHAQETANNEGALAEVKVTASKRGEQNLLDTPMAIQAVTGDQLEAQGMKQFGDYARTISGLAFEDQGPGDKKIILRGIQSTGAATTGQYFDDIVVTGNNRQDGGGRQPDIRLIDMERIEVLKGPQGTLYGASSMSGTVRMLSNKPDATKTAGSFNVGLGATDHGDGPNHDVDAMLNMPLIEDKLALRVVGYQNETAGFIDNKLLGIDGANNIRVTGGRAAMRWLVSDDLTVDAIWITQRTHADGSAWFQPIFGKFTQYNHTSSDWQEQMDAYGLSINWQVASGTVSASGSRMERDIFYRFPGTRVLCSAFGGPASECFAPNSARLEATPRWSADQPQDRTITSSELRYSSQWQSPFQMVTGVFYQKEENNFSSRITQVDLNGERIPLPSAINSNRRVNNEIEQKAVFGEFSYSFTDALTATVGIRAFQFDINEVGQNLISRTRPVAAAPVFTRSEDKDQTYKANLQYKFSSGPLVYFTYAEGFRSGGTNEPDFATGTIFPPFKSDSLKSYEIGGKGRFFGDTLQVEAAAYYMKWEDLQARIQAVLNGGSFLIQGNVGSAEIKGVEVGVLARPFDADITLGANVTALKPELTENGPVGLAGRKGDRLPNVPEFSTNVFADYGFNLGMFRTTARIDYSYVGDSYSDFNSTRPIYTRLGDYSLVNLRLMLEHDSYRVSAYVNNALNEIGWVTSSIDVRRPVEIIPTRPLTYGVTFGYSF